jgi:hypothetical protein
MATVELGSGAWNARIYELLAVASELATEMSQPRGKMLALLADRRLNRKLDGLNEGLKEVLGAFQRTVARLPGEPPYQAPERDYLPAINLVFRLHSYCAKVLAMEKLHSADRLQKAPLDNASTAWLQALSDQLFEVFDWLVTRSAERETAADLRAAEAMAEPDRDEALVHKPAARFPLADADSPVRISPFHSPE